MRFLTLLLTLLILVAPDSGIANGFLPISADSGMVVSADRFATDIGVKILKQGGNAVDAAVAVGFALAVTFPSAGNIGGGGYMMIKMDKDSVFALDYREKAPLAASRDMYLDADGNIIEKSSSKGYLSVGVPGTVAGFYKAHHKFGVLAWEDLVTPAIKLAREGFELDELNAGRLNLIREKLSQFESARKIFTKETGDYIAGNILIQNDLANTLTRIARQGAAGFYSGLTARLIEDDMKKHGGLITQEDLACYEAKWRTPLSIAYRGYQINSMPPSSSGGIVLSEILNALQYFDLQDMKCNSADLVHHWAEILRWAYADRSRWMGDVDFFNVPVNYLISDKHAEYILSNINRKMATSSCDIDVNYTWVNESEETTHYNVCDRFGNAVSNTYTINGWFGSFAVVEGAGFLLNNEMDDFSIKSGAPNLYGLTGGIANQIEPNKRMLSSMTPVIVEKNGSFYMAIGSPGGSKIITTVAQVISNVIDHQMNIRRAIESPRFHHQWLPDTIYVEPRLSTDTINCLEQRGHSTAVSLQLGTAQGILWEESTQSFKGWSDPRANGIAEGY